MSQRLQMSRGNSYGWRFRVLRGTNPVSISAAWFTAKTSKSVAYADATIKRTIANGGIADEGQGNILVTGPASDTASLPNVDQTLFWDLRVQESPNNNVWVVNDGEIDVLAVISDP